MTLIQPYQPPKPEMPTADLVEPMPASAVTGIRYMYAYGHLFESPNWFSNILFCTLCALIPVVGKMILAGYGYEVVEALHKAPRRMTPDFDFNRFSEYLVRGVWPFLIQFIVQMVLQPILTIAYYIFFGVMVVTAQSLGERGGTIAVILGSGVLMLAGLMIFLAVSLIMFPLLLRAGLAQDFGKAFDFRWIRDCIRRIWLEILLVQLFYIISLYVMALLGLLLLCIGVIPAVIAAQLAGYHLWAQLYQLYLARGGEPIPLKEPPIPMAQLVG